MPHGREAIQIGVGDLEPDHVRILAGEPPPLSRVEGRVDRFRCPATESPERLHVRAPTGELTHIWPFNDEGRANEDRWPGLSPNWVELGHLMILVTEPAPTVRPPSRIAKRRPSSMAIGWMSLTSIPVVSPGMTISVPSGSVTTPVTSVVRK